MRRKLVGNVIAKAAGLGPRQVRVRASNGAVDLVGDVLVPSGCELPSSRKVRVLADHDAQLEGVIGGAFVTIDSDAVNAIVTFLDEGVSQKADLACHLYKNGVATDVSVGFTPVESKPRQGGGYLISQWILHEISCVVLGCNPEAQVLERGYRSASRRSYGRTLTAAERTAEMARLGAIGERYEAELIRLAPTAAHRAQAIRDMDLKDALRRSAAAYGNDPFARREQREREMRRLRGD